MNRYDTMSNIQSNILSNINQNQINEVLKKKIGRLNFNNNEIAIIHKQESSQEIIPLFFGIKYNNENYDNFDKTLLYLNFHLYRLNQ